MLQSPVGISQRIPKHSMMVSYWLNENTSFPADADEPSTTTDGNAKDGVPRLEGVLRNKTVPCWSMIHSKGQCGILILHRSERTKQRCPRGMILNSPCRVIQSLALSALQRRKSRGGSGNCVTYFIGYFTKLQVLNLYINNTVR